MPDSAPLEPGDPAALGQYRVIGRIGAGGQGAVFLGQAPDGTNVAIKLLHDQMNADPSARARFAREVEAAQKVSAFCTARVLAAELTGRHPYVVSEFIDGPPLFDMVLGDGVLSGDALERLAIGTATALAAIHEAGIVHRDFKPNNVIIAPDGPRVIDFGIARSIDSNQSGVTATGMVVGTPGYLAPEQLSGEPLTPAVDIFAWGATMVFAATGRSPFEADTLPVIINRILNEQPDLSALTGTLREMVGAALDKSPARRPAAHQLLLRMLGHVGAAPSRHADRDRILQEGTQIASKLPTMPRHIHPPNPPGMVAPGGAPGAPPGTAPGMAGPGMGGAGMGGPPRMATPNPPMMMPPGSSTPPPWQQRPTTPPPWQQRPTTGFRPPPPKAKSKHTGAYIAIGVGAFVLLVIGVPIAIGIGAYHRVKNDINNTFHYGAPESMAGTWSGTVRQTNGSYTVKVTLTSGSGMANIDYANGACSGDMFEDTTSSTATKLNFNEILSNTGGGKCNGTGTVTLSQNGSTLAFEVRNIASDATPYGTGTLNKQ